MTNLSLHSQGEKPKSRLSSCNGGGASEVGGDGMMGTMGTFARLETPTMANPFFVGFSGNTGICPPRQRPLPECGGAANANQSPPVLQAISGAGEPLSWIYIHSTYTTSTTRSCAAKGSFVMARFSWQAQWARGWLDTVGEMQHQTTRRNGGRRNHHRSLISHLAPCVT